MLGLLAVTGCKPSKVIDPHKSGFDIEKFSCLDYPTNDLIPDVLRNFFPIGVNQSYIEKIMVERGGCLKIVEMAYEPQKHHMFTEIDAMTKVLIKLPVDHFAVYHITHKKPLVSVASGSMRPIVAFYDKNNKLLVMYEYTNLIHK